MATEEMKAAQAAAESENEQEQVIRHEDDMSDAPEFLKQVAEIVKEQIQPLQEQDDKNRAIIVIAVEDGLTNEEGKKGAGVSVAMLGSDKPLRTGLESFLTNENVEQVAKPVVLRMVIDREIDRAVERIKNVVKNF